MSTSRAPSAAARSIPRSTARYSATLLVATPMVSPSSSSTVPLGSEITTPTAAGPGLPRAPPSTCTTTFTRRAGEAGSGPVSLGGQLRQLAGDARPAPVAHGAVAAAGRRPAAPGGLAAVDDHLDVGIVGVIALELGEQLAGELLGDDAVDHAQDARRGGGGAPSNLRPERSDRRERPVLVV